MGAATPPFIEQAIKTMKTVEGFDRVKFIIFHGSRAEGRGIEGSDIDLCISYNGTGEEAAVFRFQVLSELGENFDVQIFQHLPLYVRTEILKGEVVYCSDTPFLYDIAYRTIREFEDFKPRFYDYIGERDLV